MLQASVFFGNHNADILSATQVVGTISCIKIEPKLAIILHKVASIHVLFHPVFVFARGDAWVKKNF